MDPEFIVYQLKRKGYSQRMVAADLEVTSSAVHHTIHNNRKSRRIREHIAEILGLNVQDIWPEKTAESEHPLRPNNNRPPCAVNQ